MIVILISPNWESQIPCVHRKLAKNIGIVHKLWNYVDLNVLKQAYYTLHTITTLVLLRFGGTTCKTKLTKIQTKQTQCVRSPFFAHNRENNRTNSNLFEILELKR